MIRRLLISTAAAIIASPAFAGTKAIYSYPHDEGRLVIEVADSGDLRMGDPGSQDYFLLLGDTFYMISPKANGWTVIRVADFAKAIDALAKRVSLPSTRPSVSKLTIEAKGRVRVNEREGTAYQVKGLESDPISFIMSDDPALRPVGRGLAHFMEEFFVMTKAPVGEGRANLAAKFHRIFAFGTPIGGDVYRLENIETTRVDPKRLALPAEPLTMDQIAAEMETNRPPSP